MGKVAASATQLATPPKKKGLKSVAHRRRLSFLAEAVMTSGAASFESVYDDLHNTD
jgi:hypothetical protein